MRRLTVITNLFYMSGQPQPAFGSLWPKKKNHSPVPYEESLAVTRLLGDFAIYGYSQPLQEIWHGQGWDLLKAKAAMRAVDQQGLEHRYTVRHEHRPLGPFNLPLQAFEVAALDSHYRLEYRWTPQQTYATFWDENGRETNLSHPEALKAVYSILQPIAGQLNITLPNGNA